MPHFGESPVFDNWSRLHMRVIPKVITHGMTYVIQKFVNYVRLFYARNVVGVLVRNYIIEMTAHQHLKASFQITYKEIYAQCLFDACWGPFHFTKL